MRLVPPAVPLPELRVLYVGARVVGHLCLDALLRAGVSVAGLLTLDSRKERVTTAFCSFDDLIERHDLNARAFTSLNTDENAAWVQDLRPHLGVVVGVSQLVGDQILAAPSRGFIGMHPTLLPEGRGRAPIPWALIKGLRRTGVSLFYCEAGADTGDILAQEEVPIYREDVSCTLGARTDRAAARLLVQSLPLLAAGTAPRVPQDDAAATTWPRRRPRDGVIDWGRTGPELYDWVRALTRPYPGAFTFVGERKLWVWQARESLDERRGAPGEVLAALPHGALVGTGGGNLLLTRVQFKGGPELDGGEADLALGDLLGRPSA